MTKTQNYAATLLREAFAAHRAGNDQEAQQIYEQCLAKKFQIPELYQNYGALLRAQGQHDRARQIYELGAKAYPDHPGILANHSNLYLESDPLRALSGHLRALNLSPHILESWLTVITIAKDHGAESWACDLLRQATKHFGHHYKLILSLINLLNSSRSIAISDNQAVFSLLAELEARLHDIDPLERAEAKINLASYYVRLGSFELADKSYASGVNDLRRTPIREQESLPKRQVSLDVGSWNYGCSLLKNQLFSTGWKFYDYGLRAPHPGKQKWQRALFKPYSSEQIPLWRGEPLDGKHLLLLAEQGIGDTMMFLTLIPALAGEADAITILMPERLAKLYSHQLPANVSLQSSASLRSQPNQSPQFDFQCALGSICQYRFTDIAHDYAPVVPFLRGNQANVSRLRQHYRQYEGRRPVNRLIGVSWSGGGNPKRIVQKSLPLTNFTQILKGIDDVRFVSLQYGDVSSVVRRWQDDRIDIIHDTNVDALNDMATWMDQVAACDAVISVANTTIHGAGALNLPTLCLLSLEADWRWLSSEAVDRSYWYPSVGIARQQRDGGWADAISTAVTWATAGSAMPSGLTYDPSSL